jgi:hypothetical protein
MPKPVDVLDKAYGHIPKEISSLNLFDWFEPPRSIKYYWLKIKRYLTRT